MPLVVNLSTLHDYSFLETVGAFAELCQKHSNGCLQTMPSFFQYGSNYAWVMGEYLIKNSSLIEPYKLGEITTEDFLDNLTEIFYFLKDLPQEERNDLLTKAWTASIQMSSDKSTRLSFLVEQAKEQPVYVVSNTNELDVRAIMQLFKKSNPELNFIEKANVGIEHSKEPVEILTNVFLCLSYRFSVFKAPRVNTAGLIHQLHQKLSQSDSAQQTWMLISNHPADQKISTELNFINGFDNETFFLQKELAQGVSPLL